MDAGDVNRLLEASRSAHMEYRRAANPATGSPPQNYSLAEQHVARALDLLQQAHEADPDHRSSGWGEQKASYDKLVGWYQRYPTIP